MKKVNIMRKCEGSTKIDLVVKFHRPIGFFFPIFLYIGCNNFFKEFVQILSHNKPNQALKTDLEKNPSIKNTDVFQILKVKA